MMKRTLPVGFLCGMMLLALLVARPAMAQGPTPVNLDDETMRIAKSLYCPVCPGVPLDVCETQACQQWRALIREKLGQGQTEEQIKQYFYDQYGERVLGAPKPEGFNLGVYVLPFAALFAGGAILFFTIRGWMRTRPVKTAPVAPPTAIDPEYARRIARELKERE